MLEDHLFFIAEIASSHHHIMGDETSGFLCYSENSWYESIHKICENQILSKKLANKGYLKFNELYNSDVWAQRFVSNIIEWINED